MTLWAFEAEVQVKAPDAEKAREVVEAFASWVNKLGVAAGDHADGYGELALALFEGDPEEVR